MYTHRNKDTHIQGNRHDQSVVHGFHRSDLYPTIRATWQDWINQVGSGSSYVDTVPNVIWRLGEHGIGAGGSSHGHTFTLWCRFESWWKCAGSFSLSNLYPHKTIKNRLWHIEPPDISAKRGPSVQPPHMFVLFFMFHFPSTHPWSLLSLQSLSCIRAWRASSVSWLTHTRKW